MAIIAIGIGVALGFAVHLVNGSALSAFGGAIRALNGAADLQVKATSPQASMKRFMEMSQA